VTPTAVESSESTGTLSLTEKLFNLAGYKGLSATSFVISSNIQFKNSVFAMNESCRKIYIAVYLNKYRTVGLLDTGSDVTIIQLSCLEKLHVRQTLESSKITEITTFSGNSIRILGQLTFLVKLSSAHVGISLDFLVMNDIPGVPKLLLGNNLLQAGSATISYNSSANQEPTVTFNHPEYFSPLVLFKNSDELTLCKGIGSLGPYEMGSMMVYLDSGAQVLRTDFILITPLAINDVVIIPSRSDLNWDSTSNCYVATACIVNLTDTTFSNENIEARFEVINKYQSILLDGEITENLRALVSKHPLGREILASSEFCNISIPLMTVNSLSAQNGSSIIKNGSSIINDEDLADTLFADSPEYTGLADLDFKIIEPSGIDLPTRVYSNPEDAVQLHKFPPHIRPFIREIFIEKYPGIVSLHSLDAGNLSLTLGYTQLRLRKGEVLPRSRRIFHVSPTDQRHLDDICDLLCKFGYIMRSPSSPNGLHLYGMSSYLVPRAKPGCLGRLIVDFSPVNQLIESPPNVIPEINHTLQFLHKKCLFSALDLRQAYLALRIDKESQPLTTFLTPSGSFQWLSLPTGAANSPAHFSTAIDKILNYVPVLDKNGKPIFESENVVKLERNVLVDTVSYFDDIIVTSELRPTYEETLRQHFANLELAVARLFFHGAKLSVSKCEFGKSKICFLGWWVSKDFVIADPRRIKKVEEYQFPTNKKSMRAFLGLINSLRKVVPLSVIKEVGVLTPLTSSKADFSPTEDHKRAFLHLKELLTSEPLYCNLIDETAEKFLWVDAATSSGVLGGVLAQRIKGESGEKVLPIHLDLEDPVHQILYDLELPYIPCTLYTRLPIVLPKPSLLKTIPPKITPQDKYLGFEINDIPNSFFWSLLSVLAIYNCNLPTSIEGLREQAVKKLRQGILGKQLLDFTFQMKYDKYNEFLDNFKLGTVGPDPNMYLIHAMALCLYRPIIIISSLERHSDKKVIHFHENCNKPPIIVGLYQRDEHEIYLPFYFNRNTEFKLDHLKGKINIIGYTAKCVPPGFESRSILDMEVFAILTTLYSFQKLISGVKVTLLTDSRVLYYLFSSRVSDSSVKIRRWCLKLISDYPQVSLHFVKTTENLADFLTREGLPKGDLVKFSLKDIVIEDFFDKLPQLNFSLIEWSQFVEDNPQYLTVNDKPPDVKLSHVLAVNTGLENVKAISTPLEILREKLSRANIIKAQKTELTELYAKCLASDNFEYIEKNETKKKTNVQYKLVFNLLMINKGHYRILVPPSLIGILLSNTHLLGHQGLTRMLADLQPYWFPHMSSVTKRFVSRCHPCFLSYRSSRKQTTGYYPVPKRAFEELMLDLCENLNSAGGYSHLLIMQDILSDFTIIVPLKSKTSSEITKVMLNGVLQNFNVEKIHTDNGPGFRSTSWLEAMSAFGVKVISSSALHPEGRGQLERLVQTVKLLLRKFLATRPTLNWEYLPYLISKILNNTVSPKTGFKPVEMVFGSENAGNLFLENKIAPPHYSIKNHGTLVSQISEEIKQMTKMATENITELRMEQSERVNRNRTNKEFKRDDIVFVLDRSIVEGTSQALRTKFSPSPYVVINPTFTTTVVRRIADGFQGSYSNNDLKLYKRFSPEFNNLPVEVARILMHDFKDFISTDFSVIATHDNLELPTSLELFVPDENYEDNEDNEDFSIKPVSKVNDQPHFNDAVKQISIAVNPVDEFATNDEAIGDPIASTSALAPAIKDNEPVITTPLSDSDNSDSDNEDPGLKLRYGRKRVNFNPGT